MGEEATTRAGWSPDAGDRCGQRCQEGVAAWTERHAPSAEPAPKHGPRWLLPVAAGIGLLVAAVILGTIVGGGPEVKSPAAAAPATLSAEEQSPATTEADAAAPARTADTTPEEVAEGYALGRSGGARTGCAQAAPGTESEQHPGCTFFVAFTGCMEGQTGEQFGPLAVEEEFPAEPALVALHEQAVQDCAR